VTSCDGDNVATGAAEASDVEVATGAAVTSEATGLLVNSGADKNSGGLATRTEPVPIAKPTIAKYFFFIVLSPFNQR
jgi:hypothetical protein